VAPHSVSPSVHSAQSCFDQAQLLLQTRHIESALGLYTRAERLGFDPDQCGGGRWYCHMLRGDFASAWRESDRIAKRAAPDPNRLWSGRTLTGKRVIVRCLHGLGDAIQFIRYVTLLHRQAAKVYVEVPGCLLRLFRCLHGVDEVITWHAPLVKPLEWDEQVEVMEFPRIYKTTLESIPGSLPYIFPPFAEKRPERNFPARLNVGFAWAASRWNPLRSIPLTALLPILSDSQVSAYNLQIEESCPDLTTIPPELQPVQTLANDDDLLVNAELILKMDLVITVDTMIAHLAGAIGKPVWLLLDYPGDWRWMMSRSDSPWYPTMRIFRQKQDRDWSAVVRQLRQAFDSFCRNSARNHGIPQTADGSGHPILPLE
jgi:hypothetical protein